MKYLNSFNRIKNKYTIIFRNHEHSHKRYNLYFISIGYSSREPCFKKFFKRNE